MYLPATRVCSLAMSAPSTSACRPWQHANHTGIKLPFCHTLTTRWHVMAHHPHLGPRHVSPIGTYPQVIHSPSGQTGGPFEFKPQGRFRDFVAAHHRPTPRCVMPWITPWITPGAPAAARRQLGEALQPSPRRSSARRRYLTALSPWARRSARQLVEVRVRARGRARRGRSPAAQASAQLEKPEAERARGPYLACIWL